MRVIFPLSLALLASLVLPAGCSSPALQDVSRTSRNTVRNQSGPLRHPYEVSHQAKDLSVVLTFNVSEGSFLYTLTDPQGTPVWQGRADKGENMNETRAFAPVPGKWLLTLKMESVTGSYQIQWKSKKIPVFSTTSPTAMSPSFR
jgi:hypothetical protein